MFTVKVDYRTKIINLGKAIQTLQQIKQQMRNRFPNDFKHGITITYSDQSIHDFQQIQQIVKTQNIQSIKLKINQLDANGTLLQSKIINPKMQPPNLTTVIQIDNNVNHNQDQNRKQQTEAVNVKFEHTNQKTTNHQEQNHINQEKVEVVIKNNIEQISQKQPQVQNKSLSKRSSSLEKSLKKSIKSKHSKGQQDQFKSLNSKSSQKKDHKVIEPSQKQISANHDNRRSRSVSKRKSQNNSQIPHKIKLPKNNKEEISSQDSIQGEHIPIYQSKQNYPIPRRQQNKQIIYSCYQCEGVFSQKCKVCYGRGKFQQNHPFVKFIDKIVEARVQKIMKQFRLKQNSPKNIKNVIKTEPKLSFEIVESKYPQKAKIGQNIYWEFEVKNTGDDWQNTMEIIDVETKETLAIGKLKRGESKKMNLGPNSYKSPGMYQKIYKLCYFKQSEIEYLNQKFGFKILVQQPEKTKQLTNYLRLRVEKIAKNIGTKYPIEYLMQKLKQMGINQETRNQTNDEMIGDIITSL